MSLGLFSFFQNLTLGINKMFAKFLKCVFLGYTLYQKGNHCIFPEVVSADVTFESVPFFGLSSTIESITNTMTIYGIVQTSIMV